MSGPASAVDDAIAVVDWAPPPRTFPLAASAWMGAAARSLDALKARSAPTVGVVIRLAAEPPRGIHFLDGLNPVAGDAPAAYAAAEAAKQLLRRLETLGTPVVVVWSGSAVDGAWEVALAGHARVAVTAARASVGLAQLAWGLMPGAGGVVRTVRRAGLAAALAQLLEGRALGLDEAQGLELIDAIAADEAEALDVARAWIREHQDAVQPWDSKAFRWPQGALTTPAVAQVALLAPAMLRQKTRGLYPAPEAILSAAVESMQVDFATAQRIESRYFGQLAANPVTRNLIAFARDQAAVDGARWRPDVPAQAPIQSVAVIGAGLMGAGIALVNAEAGLAVEVCDVDREYAARAHDYARRRRRRPGGAREDDSPAEVARTIALLARILPVDAIEALAHADLAIEAVFEDTALKRSLLARIEARMGSRALVTSNTSTLPIASLTGMLARRHQVLGLHFFSPVERMPLVEIIRAADTDDESVARAYDYVRRLGKSAVIVHDKRGFFTSRTFASFVLEGAAALGEGQSAALIENAARAAGFPAGPLALLDETALTLSLAVAREAREAAHAEGRELALHPGEAVIARMVEEFGRPGRAAGSGFYDYPAGARKHLWPGLAGAFGAAPISEASGRVPDAATQGLAQDSLKERFLYRQAIEAARCLDEGVLQSVAEANVASVLGIGYPRWTGGVLNWILAEGRDRFAASARVLADRHGARFVLGDAALARVFDVARRERPA